MKNELQGSKCADKSQSLVAPRAVVVGRWTDGHDEAAVAEAAAAIYPFCLCHPSAHAPFHTHTHGDLLECLFLVLFIQQFLLYSRRRRQVSTSE